MRLIRKIVVFLLLSNSSLLWADNTSMFTIGLSDWTGYPSSIKGFKAGLAEAGLSEGKQIQFISNENPDKKNMTKAQQHEIAQSFLKAKVDLVYSLTTPGTAIIKKVMPSTTPIVFSIVTYPADSGLIESFEYSGNNLVGTSNFVPYRHYVFLLHKMLPNTQSIAIFHRKGEPNSKIQASNIRRILRKQGIEVVIKEPTSLNDIRVMAKSLINKVDVFMTTTDTLMQSGGESVLIELSLAHAIPILSSNKAGIEAGSTFGPVADFHTLGKISGKMAARILQDNIQPSQLSSKLQEPPQFIINKRSAKQLNIKIPSDLDVVFVQ